MNEQEAKDKMPPKRAIHPSTSAAEESGEFLIIWLFGMVLLVIGGLLFWLSK